MNGPGTARPTSYDPAGNRTRKETPAALTLYEWDEDDRLVKAEPIAGEVEFDYNAAGQRVRKTTAAESLQYLYDFKRLLQETDGDGAPERSYTHAESLASEYGNLVSEYDAPDDEDAWHAYDGLGKN